MKIYGQTSKGSWEKKVTIYHKCGIQSATFSPDDCHVVTASLDGTSKIIGQRTDGSWLERGSISHDDTVFSATFSADGSHVVTASKYGTVKITELQGSDSLFAVTE